MKPFLRPAAIVAAALLALMLHPSAHAGFKDANDATRAARKDAAQQLQRPEKAISVVSTRAVQWPDAALGCPQPDMMYAQAVTPGWRIELRAGKQKLDYRAGKDGTLVLCPAKGGKAR